jgi:hypothetical protein
MKEVFAIELHAFSSQNKREAWEFLVAVANYTTLKGCNQGNCEKKCSNSMAHTVWLILSPEFVWEAIEVIMFLLRKKPLNIQTSKPR